MKKLIFLLASVFLLQLQPKAQIDAIKAAADGISLLSDVGSSGGCNDLGCLFFIDDLVIVTIEGLTVHHNYLMDNRDIFPSALSLEYMPHFASNGDNQFSIFQRLRGTFGVMSTDFRFNVLTEFQNNTAQQYRTIDWQIMQLNFQAGPVVNLRFGSGILYDSYAENTYNEHFGSIGLSFFDYRFTTELEGRYCPSYTTAVTVYEELNLRAKFRIIEMESLSTWFMVGGVYQSYYDVAEYKSLQTGLTIELH